MTAQEESLADKGTSDNTEDLYKWANGLLLHSLAGMPVIPHGGDVRASFVAPELNSELQFYGDIFGCRPTRTVTFEVRVVMHYVGKVFLGDACMGELRGYINVPKIRHDTMNEDFEVVVHGYELSPQGHIERNLCPAEHSILEGIKGQVHHIRARLRAVLSRLLAYYEREGEECKQVLLETDSAAGAPDETKPVLSEKLRQECMPLKYKSFLEDVSQGKVEELKTVDLTFCTLQEPDVDKVMEALKACVHTITLDLQYNELKDVALQKLVGLLAAGGLPELKTLRIGNNQFTDTGKTMLKGLSIIRKQVKLFCESELD